MYVHKPTWLDICYSGGCHLFIKGILPSWNIQENTCVGVFFNKVVGLRPAQLYQKETPTVTQVFSQDTAVMAGNDTC